MQQPEEPEEQVVEVTPEVPEPEVLSADTVLLESDVPAGLEAPPPKREPFWGYTDIALVFGLLFAFSAVLLLLVGLLALRYPRLRTDPAPIAMPVQILFYVAVYFSFRVVFALRYHEPVFRSLGWRRPQYQFGCGRARWFSAGVHLVGARFAAADTEDRSAVQSVYEFAGFAGRFCRSGRGASADLSRRCSSADLFSRCSRAVSAQ